MPAAGVVGAVKATVPALFRVVTVELPLLFQVALSRLTLDVPAATAIVPFNTAPFSAFSVLTPATELNTLLVPLTVPPFTVILLVPPLASSAVPLAFTVAPFSVAVPLSRVRTATLLLPFSCRLPAYSTVPLFCAV